MTSAAKPAGFYGDFAGLAALKKSAGQQDPQALREAARQFESLFTQMMLKSMRSASLTGSSPSLMDSDQSNFYRDMYDNQLSLQMSKGKGLGLADMLVRQLSTSGTLGAPKTSAPNATVSGIAVSASALRMPSVRVDSVATQPVINARQQIVPPPTAGVSSCTSPLNVALPSASPASTVISIPAPTETPATPTTTVEAAPAADPASDPAANATPTPMATTPADFVRQMWPHAVAVARELGVDPNTLIAHAALETGWGKFVPCNPDGSCSFNLFGIKAGGKWQGPRVGVNSLEFEGGVPVARNASFRAYSSPADSFRDYAMFLKNSPRYANALNTGADATAFGVALQQGGYATDPNYASKLASVASRLKSIQPTNLKFASTPPLSTGRSVSGDNT